MKFGNHMFYLDYLVFSSHKTATQTVTETLRKNNFRCVHCHILENVGIEIGAFKYFLIPYYLKNKKRLNIISTFREPIERQISSFFQYYGKDVIRLKQVDDITDTIIHKWQVHELQKKMIDELNNPFTERLERTSESIDQICSELNINIKELNYRPQAQYGLCEKDTCRIFTFRFDILTNNLETLLSTITQTPIQQHNKNLTTDKWYNPIYREFIASLKIPHATIRKIYETRRDLINLFYPDQYDSLLAATIDRYGE